MHSSVHTDGSIWHRMLWHCIPNSSRFACADSCPKVPGFTFYQGRDSMGGDIGEGCRWPGFDPKSFDDVASLCSKGYDCLAFNTAWCLKNKVETPPPHIMPDTRVCAGIYIKSRCRDAASKAAIVMHSCQQHDQHSLSLPSVAVQVATQFAPSGAIAVCVPGSCCRERVAGCLGPQAGVHVCLVSMFACPGQPARHHGPPEDAAPQHRGL
jgi:hypothetical protein